MPTPFLKERSFRNGRSIHLFERIRPSPPEYQCPACLRLFASKPSYHYCTVAPPIPPNS